MREQKYYNKEDLVFGQMPYTKSFKNITDIFYDRLTVIGFAYIEKRRSYWYCQCSCGNVVKIALTSLQQGKTKSCGCINKEAKHLIKHGHSIGGTKSVTYIKWQGMIDRCTNPNSTNYKNYGARGIKVCDRWLKFENFLEDMGEAPEKLTIDRIENDKGYYKENCRWISQEEQCNNKRTNSYHTFNGKTQTIRQWSRELSINHRTLHSRLTLQNMTIEDALLTPIKGKKYD